MNKETIDLLIEKYPSLKKENARSKLEAMQPGVYCRHRSWGFGQIKDYNSEENKLLIDFENGRTGHAMDPVFCINKLELLTNENILARQRIEPERIDELIKKRPADLVVEVLSQSPDNELTTIEIEHILGLLFSNSKLFRKWWNNTKKILVKDPRIATPNKKTAPYFLRDEPLKPEQEILEEFKEMQPAKDKILLAEKLYKFADSVEEIANDLPNIFSTLTDCIQNARNLSQAERLHGIWVRNDLARHLHKDVDAIDPTSASLIKANEGNLHTLAIELPSVYQKRFLDLLTRVYPDDQEATLLEQLRNSTGKYTNECINFLIEKGFTDQVTQSMERWLSEQNIKGPVLYWIVKNRHSRKFSRLVKNLINPSLLNSIFWAIDNEILQNESTRRIPLADILSDDSELIGDLLAEANAETGYDLAQALLLNQGFADLEKKSILARFIKIFPSIQSLLTGDEPQKEATELIVSQASFDLRKKEYQELVSVKIPENKNAIVTAREHGDLRENAEYKMAKEEQETLIARKNALDRDLARARITDFNDVSEKAVGIGSVVKLHHLASQKKYTYSILGAWDSEPEKSILSYKTPLGQSLLGKGVGETVKTTIDNNEEEWTIEKISRWVDL